MQSWEIDHRFVAATIYGEAFVRGRASARARALYFGDVLTAERVFTELADCRPHLAFAEWWAADYRPTKRSRTVIERLLDKRGSTRSREPPSRRGDGGLARRSPVGS